VPTQHRESRWKEGGRIPNASKHLNNEVNKQARFILACDRASCEEGSGGWCDVWRDAWGEGWWGDRRVGTA
jgi:hypothetical protein